MVEGNCQECGKFTNNLVGLFVPYLCIGCLDIIRIKQIKANEICKLCKKPYCDCYC